jgi:hypothetical protein
VAIRKSLIAITENYDFMITYDVNVSCELELVMAGDKNILPPEKEEISPC